MSTSVIIINSNYIMVTYKICQNYVIMNVKYVWVNIRQGYKCHIQMIHLIYSHCSNISFISLMLDYSDRELNNIQYNWQQNN